MKRNNRLPALILSIQAVHADRIFNGIKRFELRKSLPKGAFKRVYLWETGGIGIVGCFDAGDPLRLPINELWTRVGELATSEERFCTYFKESRMGCAIPVQCPFRFPEPITKREMVRFDPTFSVPVSYRLVPTDSRLFRALEAERTKRLKPPYVRLRRIRAAERGIYSELVTQVIAPKYDEISSAFASSILNSDKLGYDPYGILTKKKEVLSVILRDGSLIGFTTLTFKHGGSVKTGPTVLLQAYQQRGFGAAVRNAIAVRAAKHGARKLYCTCPDNDQRVAAYLLRAGYRIEAHLWKHYTRRNGELVFGFSIAESASIPRSSLPRSNFSGGPIDIRATPKRAVVEFFCKWFSSVWVPISAKVGTAMLGGVYRQVRRTEYRAQTR